MIQLTIIPCLILVLSALKWFVLINIIFFNQVQTLTFMKYNISIDCIDLSIICLEILAINYFHFVKGIVGIMLDGCFGCRHRKTAGLVNTEPREKEKVFLSQDRVDDFVKLYGKQDVVRTGQNIEDQVYTHTHYTHNKCISTHILSIKITSIVIQHCIVILPLCSFVSYRLAVHSRQGKNKEKKKNIMILLVCLQAIVCIIFL